MEGCIRNCCNCPGVRRGRVRPRRIRRSGQRQPMGWRPKARNVIFFIGDGMGVSTITAARVFSVGVDGQLVARSVPAHGAVADLFGRLDHARQRADHDGDDDRHQHQPERHRLRREDRGERLQPRRRRRRPLDAARAGKARGHESRRRSRRRRSRTRRRRRPTRISTSATTKTTSPCRPCRPMRPTTSGSAAASTS